MPANSRSTKSSRKVKKKSTKKVTETAAKKSARKVGKKAAKKTGKKARRKVAKKVAKKAARPPQGPRKKVFEVSAERRREMIEKAAYYRAEKRHFQGGDPVADWLSCEKEVDVLLSRASS